MTEVKPKVWRGEKKYQHTSDFEIELLKLERILDGEHQRQRNNKRLSRALGITRSILGRLGHKQKTMKRWQQIRPNKARIGE